MLIKIRFPNHRLGYDFLYYNFFLLINEFENIFSNQLESPCFRILN